jgi:endo-1,4-beta-xylanase
MLWGIQAHLFSHKFYRQFDPKRLKTFIGEVADLGLKIMITELDVIDSKLPKDINIRDRMVAAVYEDYLSVVLEEPAVIAVMTWGLSDRYTWISKFAPREDDTPVRPLPLDNQLNRKLAWNAIARAFDSAPQAESLNSFLKVKDVGSEALTGKYYRFSNSWQCVIKDLWF